MNLRFFLRLGCWKTLWILPHALEEVSRREWVDLEGHRRRDVAYRCRRGCGWTTTTQDSKTAFENIRRAVLGEYAMREIGVPEKAREAIREKMRAETEADIERAIEERLREEQP